MVRDAGTLLAATVYGTGGACGVQAWAGRDDDGRYGTVQCGTEQDERALVAGRFRTLRVRTVRDGGDPVRCGIGRRDATVQDRWAAGLNGPVRTSGTGFLFYMYSSSAAPKLFRRLRRMSGGRPPAFTSTAHCSLRPDVHARIDKIIDGVIQALQKPTTLRGPLSPHWPQAPIDLKR